MDHAFSRVAFARAVFAASGIVCMASHASALDLHNKAKPVCPMTYERVVAIARDIVSRDAEAAYNEYAADEARRLINAINAVEPVTHWTGDKVVVIDVDGEQPFRVALIERNCATRAFPVPRAAWPALVVTAIGSKT